MSKTLDVPRNTVKAIINKERKWSTTVTSPRTGRPSKIHKRTRQNLTREAAKRPTAMMNEHLRSTDYSLDVATSRILHTSGLWGRPARREPFLIKDARRNVLWSHETNSKRYVWCKKKVLISKTPPHPGWSTVAAASRFRAGFYSGRTGAFMKVSGITDSYKHRSILVRNFRMSVSTPQTRRTLTFHPKHTSKSTKEHLHREKINHLATAQTRIQIEIRGVTWRL